MSGATRRTFLKKAGIGAAALARTALRTKRVVQHGTQSRSGELVAGAVQMLREGVIVDVLVAKAWNIQ